MKTPDQLPLDFSASDADGKPVSPTPRAAVYKIENYRAREGRAALGSLSGVYAAIHEAVKHVTVRSRVPRNGFVESRHP